jgi:hypothetical protein
MYGKNIKKFVLKTFLSLKQNVFPIFLICKHFKSDVKAVYKTFYKQF